MLTQVLFGFFFMLALCGRCSWLMFSVLRAPEYSSYRSMFLTHGIINNLPLTRKFVGSGKNGKQRFVDIIIIILLFLFYP